jgi:hypothetical protein
MVAGCLYEEADELRGGKIGTRRLGLMVGGDKGAGG